MPNASIRTRLDSVVLAVSVVAMAACSGTGGLESRPHIAGADATRGKALIVSYGCGSCHIVPGVKQAQGLVGPPLIHWSGRRLIAGEITNTPEHLITWLTVPQSVEPGTGMPNLGVSDDQARDIAAYLYTLK